jgi:hypothetical protein
MFVGHTAVALAAKSRAPGASLGTFLAAAYTCDLLWPIFLLLGIERVRIDPGNTRFTPLALKYYPWSHSLVMAIVWGIVGAGIVRLFGRDRRTQALVLLLVGLSTFMWAGQPWTTPPPTPHALAMFGLGAWMFPLWAGWAGRHRIRQEAT